MAKPRKRLHLGSESGVRPSSRCLHEWAKLKVDGMGEKRESMSGTVDWRVRYSGGFSGQTKAHLRFRSNISPVG